MLKRYLIAACWLLFFRDIPAQSTFFSEDFGGGFPAGWLAVKRMGNNHPASNWRRTTIGPQGNYQTDPLDATTASNGWMILDSDFSCSFVPPQQQDAWLISPPIDASDKDTVWLLFENYYQSFNDRPAIRIGSDLENLEEWENIEVFPGIGANQFGGIIEGEPSLNPQVVRMNLSDYFAGQSNVRFAFQFLSTNQTLNGGEDDLIGCAYNWQIDDVKLIDYDPRPANDIRVDAFYAIAPNAITPRTQTEPIGFLADIRNAGYATQPETTLKITISNSSGVVVFQDSLLYGPIGSDSIAQNIFFQTEFTPPPVAETYTATYTAYPFLEDEILANNSRSFEIEISDTLFAKQLGATQAITATGSTDYTIGNVFFVPNGANLYARYLSFAVANAEQLSGRTVNTYLYRWYGNENGDFVASPDEYGGGPVGANAYTFSGSEGSDLITVPVDFEGNGIALESNTYYIATVQYQTNDQQAFRILGSSEFDYHATYLYTDSMMRPRYAGVIDVGNTGDLDWTGIGLDVAPVVRLSIGSVTPAADRALPQNAARIHPNPVKDAATLELNLPAVADRVSLQLFDNTGRAIWERRLSNFQQGHLPIQTNDLPPGMYWLRIRTKSGMTTLKMDVVR